MGVSARDVISTRSKVYQSRRDEIDAMSESDLIRMMTEEPTLIRRPIVVADSVHVIGSRKSDLEAFASQAE
jgi:regulatory protein spx